MMLFLMVEIRRPFQFGIILELTEKWERAMKSVDEMRDKFGFELLRPASQ